MKLSLKIWIHFNTKLSKRVVCWHGQMLIKRLEWFIHEVLWWPAALCWRPSDLFIYLRDKLLNKGCRMQGKHTKWVCGLWMSITWLSQFVANIKATPFDATAAQPKIINSCRVQCQSGRREHTYVHVCVRSHTQVKPKQLWYMAKYTPTSSVCVYVCCYLIPHTARACNYILKWHSGHLICSLIDWLPQAAKLQNAAWELGGHLITSSALLFTHMVPNAMHTK
jgi:hypothetical protein